MEEFAGIRKESIKLSNGVTKIHFRDSSRIQVLAMINNKREAKFVLDTGASQVVFSRELAKKIGLDISGKKTIPLTLADKSIARGGACLA